MARGRTWLIACVLAVAALNPVSSRGQIVHGEGTRGRLRLISTTWTVAGDREMRLHQVLMPFFGYVPLGENAEGMVYIARSTNTLRGDGRNDHLHGFTDARLQVNRSFAEDRLLISGGASLPTGKVGLNLGGDLRVMDMLSHDYLTFPNRRLGEGFGLNGMVGGALVLGEYRLGSSLSYHYSGAYEAFAGQGSYRPGPYLRAFGGVKRKVGSVNFASGITLTSFGDDTLAGRKVYNRGLQTEFNLQGSLANPGFQATLQGLAFLRGSNKIFDLTGTELSQIDLFGNEVALSGACSWFFRGRALEIGPVVNLRFITGNDLGVGKAHAVAAGVQSFAMLARIVRLGLSYEHFTGEADGGALDISGYQIAASLSGAF